MFRPLGVLEEALRAQTGHLFAWVPVCLAVGIGGYFQLPAEPDVHWVYASLVISIMLGFWLSKDRSGFLAIPIGLLLLIIGFNLALWRAHDVAAPKLDLPYKGLVEGRIISVDRSASDALRLTLDRVWMRELGERPQPERIRVSLHGDAVEFDPVPLQTIRLYGRLSPPGGPVEPGGFDFQRHAWFLQLGALGYTRTPIEVLKPAPNRVSIPRLRHLFSERIQNQLSGEVGGVAAAITTGDRSGLLKSTTERLRITNLAHLLAISGLHMGLLVGVVFTGLRVAMALVQPIALRWATKKIAAGGALCAAYLYLLLSGGSVATERAFVMAAVALVAILIDRRAISLRSVAIAAIIVLFLRPESLLSPGYQMSFSATTALVWVFSMVRNQAAWPGPKWFRSILGIVLTSAVAGAATAPFAAAHFNAYSAYGLPANLLAVPVMGLIVMPSAVIALCLAPVGLEGLGLTLMGWGLEWILFIATLFSDIEGARVPISAPPSGTLELITSGLLILGLWQGRIRVFGVPLVILATVSWITAERPDVLISEEAALVGVLKDGKRVLSKKRGQGFIASVWLENDGDAATQERAFARQEALESGVFKIEAGGLTIWHIYRKSKLKDFRECARDEIVIAIGPLDISGPCMIIEPDDMATTGALSGVISNGKLELKTVAETRGHRIWLSQN